MMVRVVLAFVVALLAAGGLAACSSAPGAGDCVERTGDSYSTTDCATASLRVLGLEDSSGDCIAVPGVTETYSSSGSDSVLCLGPRDVDPAAAINVAQDGDCVAGVEANSDVRRLACADPAAEAVVLSRIENATTIVGDPCSSEPGVSSSYSWDMVSTGDDRYGLGAIDGLGVDLLFCLGPVGVDPNTSPDTAQAGDCLAETTGDPGYVKVDCGAPDAAHRVVERVEGGILGIEIACASARGATSGIQRGGGLDGYVLCLAPN
jgi:hypothetical protein